MKDKKLTLDELMGSVSSRETKELGERQRGEKRQR
jgi:hypothetical protein